MYGEKPVIWYVSAYWNQTTWNASLSSRSSSSSGNNSNREIANDESNWRKLKMLWKNGIFMFACSAGRNWWKKLALCSQCILLFISHIYSSKASSILHHHYSIRCFIILPHFNVSYDAEEEMKNIEITAFPFCHLLFAFAFFLHKNYSQK